MILDIVPCPKPRMTQSDRWRSRPPVKRYFDFRKLLLIEAKKKGYKIQLPLSITFILPMSKSWSKKKKLELDGQPHIIKPDLDNLIKAFKDALLEEDSHVWCYGRMEKIWGKEGKIIIKE